MAAAQQYFPYPQGKGTLMPGQTIIVNKYTIQIERYLSQGGFAHVYLVRTPTPVYNTTHHVLKRIAVPDQTMLAEVKKEVDIMRSLKGHPNIVHFIDAAWHKMSNGMFEIFILMEYCPGGGIIDMMNRRLRERLTEAEILQIFVDVCEAVAYMHNLRPPLLHRDLKVENILQSSHTSYKLCDFGSSAPVSKAPSNMQELRAIEADLNKHTTMQYRAPEMIDVHMRRPIDEKSDVWALGVLLYKLCYYTTPFEEHGPLAILQVSYKIPPYPVYSPQLNSLIGKMLKDHGATRPTIFEVLSDIHRMRGTKSQFQYNAPVPQPLSQSRLPRPGQSPITILDSKSRSHQSSPSVPPVVSQGQLAREKVMEAIAPMRRGRPTPPKEHAAGPKPNSRPSSPQKIFMGGKLSKSNFDEINMTGDEKAWKTWATGAQQSPKPPSLLGNNDAWRIENDKEHVQANPRAGFNDNFADKFTEPSAPIMKVISRQNLPPKSYSHSPSPSIESSTPVRYTPQATAGYLERKIPRTEKDAFDGLGLGFPSEKRQPTLGEARKLRTGLAIVSSTRPNRLEQESRPVASPKPSFLTPQPYMQTQGFLSTSPSDMSSIGPTTQAASRPSSSMNIDGMPMESRFPSLEELDASFSGTSGNQRTQSRPPFSAKSSYMDRSPNIPQDSKSNGASDPVPTTTPTAYDKQGSSHTRVFEAANDTGDSLRLNKNKALPSTMMGGLGPRRVASLTLKPTVTRRQTSISTKLKPTADTDAPTALGLLHPPEEEKSPLPLTSSSSRPRDWLTGEDSFPSTPIQSDVPVLRQSPRKRASVIEKSDIEREATVARPQHAAVVQQLAPEPDFVAEISPTVTKFTQLYPPVESTDKNAHETRTSSGGEEIDDSSSSSADEGPEDVNRLSVVAKSGSVGRSSRRHGRQSSVHDLVDLWGGGVQQKDSTTKSQNEEVSPLRERAHDSSSVLKALSASIKRPSSPELQELVKQPPSVESKRTITSGRTPPPSSGRARPQSLFLFPSKSAETPSHSSTLLEAPPEPKRRESRRNSITDMVERYEAISMQGPVPRSPSPLAMKKTSSGKGTSQPHGGDSLPSLTIPSAPTTPVKMQRPSPTRVKALASPSYKAEVPAVSAASAVTTSVPRARKQSLKPFENLKPPVSLQKLLSVDDKKERPSAIADRSPSPERSYQGVGKLIDQWQRKAEAAEPPAWNKRNSIITKRPP
ncbi:hypothetical protein JOM56_006588 [Amanita muscaria]